MRDSQRQRLRQLSIQMTDVALGQKQTFAAHQPKSALPPIATLTAFFGSSAFGNSGHLRSKADVIGYNLATSVVCFRVG
jgi:hypothetical protein